MGGKESKQFPISYEEAVKRVTESEKRRIQDAFRRCSVTNNYLSKQAFLSSVLGEGIPGSLGEQIFNLVCSSGSRGITLRELLPLLVLLTRGTREEKVKFLYGVLAGEGGSCIERADCLRLCGEWEEKMEAAQLAATLFQESDRVTFSMFAVWIEKNHQKFGLAEWLLNPTNCMSLISSHLADMPTFYQTLAGVTHLSEQEIMELEKRFWHLVGTSASGRIDNSIICGLVSPPLPEALVPGLFRAFDENQDGHVDFKELACGVSAACRGPDIERQKFCFKIFDSNNDGVLNGDDIRLMVDSMLRARLSTSQSTAGKASTRQSTDGKASTSQSNGGKVSTNPSTASTSQKISPAESKTQTDKLVADLLARASKGSQTACSQIIPSPTTVQAATNGRSISLEDYLVWTTEAQLPREFARLVFELCHVVLGLRPASRREEADIVRGWLEREEAAGFWPGQVWYLVPMSWWTSWHNYVNWSGENTAPTMMNGTLGRRKGSNLAMDNSNQVVATGYTLIEPDSRPPTPVSVRSNGPSGVGRQTSTPGNSPLTQRKSSNAYSTTSSTGSGNAVATTPPVVVPSRPGLIDTSSLLQSPPAAHRGITVLTGEGGRLRNNGRLVRGKDYELVPERLWKFLAQMYGGSPPLPRQVIRTKQGQIELELNPLCVAIFKHQTIQRQPNVPTIVGGYSAAAMQAGVTSTGYSGLVGGSGPPTVTRRYHAFQASFSRRIAIGQIDDFLCQRLHVKHEDLRLWLYRSDENKLLLLDQENTTLEDAGFRDDDNNGLLAEIRSRDGTWPEEISSLCGDKRSQADRQPLVPGVTGLNNLGNTCYMNAALQVVSSTKILAQYFKLNCHLYELNRTNPLGMKGHIAKRFGDLVRDMWSGELRTLAPIKLRWTIGKYEPNFASFQQQDSQELLVFLLDGLHEDLNRVTEKPYAELRDSNGRPDIEVAAEAWENHILRNKSIIVDLFHGQLKSKVTCRVCGHESVRFDPFFNLSLPLPMERCTCIEVVVLLQDGSTPIKYGLTVDMEDRLSVIPPRLARLCGVPHHNLVLVEIIQSQICLISTNEVKLRGLSGSCIYAYELARSCQQHQQPLATTALRLTSPEAGGGDQSIADIQRSVHSKLKVKSSLSTSSNGSQSELTEPSDAQIQTPNPRLGGGGAQAESPSRPSGSDGWNSGEGVGGGGGVVGRGKNAGAGQISGVRDEALSSVSSSNSDSLLDDSLHSIQESAQSPARQSSADLSTTPPSPPPPPPSDQLQQQYQHSRASSTSSTLTIGLLDTDRTGTFASLPVDFGDFSQGVLVCLHRKMIPQEFYFLSSEKYRPAIFGVPIVVNCSSNTSGRELYSRVWEQVARLVSPLPPQDQGQTPNHAADCDDSLGYEYPFVLKAVRAGGSWCALCPWTRLCRGCPVPCTATALLPAASFYAVDWDPTALHLRYLAGAERAWLEDPSVAASRRAATEPITLSKCLEAFTQEEQLGEKEKYYCSACQTHQLAVKKLQIWRLPPVLIVHLKRFQCVNERWIKSHKIVDFPISGLDPTDYLAAVPAATLRRYKELVRQGKYVSRSARASLLSGYSAAAPIDEGNEVTASVATNDVETAPTTELGEDVASRLSAAIVTSELSGQPLETSDEDPNDSGIESSGGHPTLERRASSRSDVFITTAPEEGTNNTWQRGDASSKNNSSQPLSRTRQISTSLAQDPVHDDNLQDFHAHLLEPGRQPLDIKYNMYAMVCHSGALGGGHYVSYSKTESGTWYCHNDSACKEVPETSIDKSTAYILLYEREGLSLSDYLPDTRGLKADTGSLDEELDSDFKKQCVIM